MLKRFVYYHVIISSSLLHFKDATVRLVANHDRNVANNMASSAGGDGTALNAAFVPSSLHKENLTDVSTE